LLRCQVIKKWSNFYQCLSILVQKETI